MNVFPLELTYEIKTKDDIAFVIFGGADKQLLLWKDGALLLAIQHLLNKISRPEGPGRLRILPQAQGEVALRDYALDVAQPGLGFRATTKSST